MQQFQVGHSSANVFDERLSAVVATHRTQPVKVVTTLGSPENTGIASGIVSEASQVLAEMLGVHSDPIRAGVRRDLLDALVAQGGDPDTAVPEWFRSGSPMGIVRQMQANGVFPPSDGLKTPRRTVQSVESTPVQPEATKNIASFYEHEVAANAEMEIEIQKGFVVWEFSRATLEAKVWHTCAVTCCNFSQRKARRSQGATHSRSAQEWSQCHHQYSRTRSVTVLDRCRRVDREGGSGR